MYLSENLRPAFEEIFVLRERVRVVGRSTPVGRGAVGQGHRLDGLGVVGVRLRPRHRRGGVDDVPLQPRSGRPGTRRLRHQRQVPAGRILVRRRSGDGHPRLHPRRLRPDPRRRRRSAVLPQDGYLVTSADQEIAVPGPNYFGQPFDSYYRTRWLHAGWPDRKKSWRRPTFVCRQVTATSTCSSRRTATTTRRPCTAPARCGCAPKATAYWTEAGFDEAAIGGFDWTEGGIDDPGGRGADWGLERRGSNLIRAARWAWPVRCRCGCGLADDAALALGRRRDRRQVREPEVPLWRRSTAYDLLNYTPASASPVEANFNRIEQHINQELIERDGTVAMRAQLKLVGDPVAPLDAAPKQYVDQVLPIGIIMMYGGVDAACRWALGAVQRRRVGQSPPTRRCSPSSATASLRPGLPPDASTCPTCEGRFAYGGTPRGDGRLRRCRRASPQPQHRPQPSRLVVG